MSLPLRLRAPAVFILVSMGIGLAASQDAPPVTAVLASGKVRYVEPASKESGPAPATGAKPLLAGSTRSALERYAPYFGIGNPAEQLRQFRSTSRGAAGDILRYRQLHDGVPVIGGELVLSLDGAGNMLSLSGEVATDLKLRSSEPAITAAQARQTALAAAGKYYPDLRAGLTASEPELSVYDPALIGPAAGLAARLVWRIEVKSADPAHLRELILVNAGDGAVALHFNQIETALRQATHTANSTGTLPGTLLCDETQPLCTGGTNTDADLAHRYGRETYDFYMTHHGRDSFDGLGATLISSVNYLSAGFPCPNAAWTGTQMIYCAGAPAADDVVGHELTHAVTDRTSDLFYYYQSGAINESFSDVWGEFVDLGNGSGNDAASVRWLIGEDFAGLGAIRNMANPPQFNQPDRMRSTLYSLSGSDNGGVHRNSGVNNKAAALLVDGGRFNGYTISGIGIDKVAALYYRVQTQHLTSGSDYADLYLALNQACRNMIGGAAGIVADDCLQVANATEAVEMRLTPTADAGTEAAVCPVNQVPNNTYFDSFEDSAAATRWVNARLTGTLGSWYRALLGTDGTVSFATAGSNGISNHTLTMATPVVVPAGAFLHLRHLFDQEAASTAGGTAYFDGGFIEYSIDGGTTWLDAGTLYSGGKHYNGTLNADNPSAGSMAFVGASHGFVSTRYDLSSLAGASLLVRFRNTSDSSVSTGIAWVLDEFRIYSCGTNATQNLNPVASAGADQTVAPAVAVTIDGSASFDTDGYIASAQWTQLGGTQVTMTPVGRSMNFSAPLTPVQQSLVFRLTVTDDRGATATDDVTITVINQQPVANAGTDQATRPRDIVLLQATATDADGTIAGYSWAQTGGPTLNLDKFFTVPLQGATTQAFWLSTTPYAVGGSFLYLNFGGNALTNLGGSVALQPGSEFSICQQVTGNLCTTRFIWSLTGSVSAPVTADPTLPATWTLQNVRVSDGTPVTGSFVFNAATITLTSIQVTSASPRGRVLSFRSPSVPDSATLTFRVTSTDNAGGTGSDEVSVTVTNQQPTANAGADQASKPRLVVSLTGVAQDPDGVIASTAWTQVSGPATTIMNATSANASIIVPSVVADATLVFRLTVADNDNAIASDDVSVGVTNLAPSVNAGADTTVNAGATVALAASATDPDGLVSTYSWAQTAGPPVTLSGASTATAQFSAPAAGTASALTFQVTATDNDGATAVDLVTVNVNAKAASKGGGGSLDGWTLAALLMLLLGRVVRQRRLRVRAAAIPLNS